MQFAGVEMCKIAIVQLYKCANAHNVKYSILEFCNVQLAQLQMCKCTETQQFQTCNCANKQWCKCSEMHMWKCTIERNAIVIRTFVHVCTCAVLQFCSCAFRNCCSRSRTPARNQYVKRENKCQNKNQKAKSKTISSTQGAAAALYFCRRVIAKPGVIGWRVG